MAATKFVSPAELMQRKIEQAKRVVPFVGPSPVDHHQAKVRRYESYIPNGPFIFTDTFPDRLRKGLGF